MKSAALMMLALFIDGVQAAISVSLALVAAFPGTVAGAAGGCWAGSALLGSWACGIGAFVFGLLGTSVDVVAPVTEPVGLVIGFAVSVCLSMTLGAGLIMLLIICDMFYPKYILPGTVTELIPGLDILPTWSGITWASILEKKRREAKQLALRTASEIVSPSVDVRAEVEAGRPIDGIRAPVAANDNNVPSAQRYAA